MKRLAPQLQECFPAGVDLLQFFMKGGLSAEEDALADQKVDSEDTAARQHFRNQVMKGAEIGECPDGQLVQRQPTGRGQQEERVFQGPGPDTAAEKDPAAAEQVVQRGAGGEAEGGRDQVVDPRQFGQPGQKQQVQGEARAAGAQRPEQLHEDILGFFEQQLKYHITFLYDKQAGWQVPVR